MRFGSVCSGIEAASVAWHPLGWKAAWVAEIEPFPSAVLAAHWPTVPNLGDFTRIAQGVDVEPVELLVGGTPCQSFSVAGKRRGLDDPRGNLTLEFLALAGRLRPRWVVWENVPGVLSDDGGRTFGAVLGLLGELGYGFAYRVLDAQFFGVPQRRRRVFVVGHLGAWQRAAAVLLEPASLRGDLAPSRSKGEGVAASLTHGVDSGGRGGGRGGYAVRRREDDVNIVPDTAPTIFAAYGTKWNGNAGVATGQLVPSIAPLGAKRDGGWHGDLDNDTYVAHSLRADGFDASEDGTGRGTPLAVGFYPTEGRDFVAFDEASPAVKVGSGGTSGNPPGVAFQEAQTGCREYAEAGTLRSNGPGHDPVGTRICEGMKVRRLTPRECERLQGFPDDYTAITYKGKPAADGPRYRALGNSMAVPVMAWVGRRIQMCEDVS